MTATATLLAPGMALYFCWDHRDQTKVERKQSAEWTHRPVCPICFACMYWVPSGGAEVPPRQADEERAP